MRRLRHSGAILLVCALAARAGERPRRVREAYPNLVHGMLSVAALAELPEGVLLRCTELDISRAELEALLAGSPPALREQLRKHAVYLLDELATKKVLAAAARQEAAKAQKSLAGKSDEAIVDAYVQGITAGLVVSDAEAAEFYERNREMFGGDSFRKVRAKLEEFLLKHKRRQAVEERMLSLCQSLQLAVSAPWMAEHVALARDNPVDRARASGLPSMVDFGADGCRPCEKMKPVLAALKEKFAGKANIVFVHTRKHVVLSIRYGIESIPVQVFFDKGGRETYRHTGFFSQADIEKKLRELGVE